LAWLPSSLLILLYLLSTPNAWGRPRAKNPCFAAEKLGPFGTIAKESIERKEKSQKRLEKCGFFVDRRELPVEMRVTDAFRDSDGEATSGNARTGSLQTLPKQSKL
jgi:hypothetical protein